MKRQIEIHELLIKAAEAYEQGSEEIMSNFEYDKLYDELVELEKRGTVLPGSVTQKPGYDVQSKLGKVEHDYPILSLNKTKDPSELGEILGDKEGIMSWKEDGITVVVTLDKGKIVSAVTRGNGKVGEDVTENFRQFNIGPLSIPTDKKIVLRGEALISYRNFEEINNRIEDIDDKYKNPRNLCSGSVRQLDPKITKERNIEYVVFEVKEGFDECKLKSEKLEKVREIGFEVVDYIKVTKENLQEGIKYFENKVKEYRFPTDGLVLTIDNIAHSRSLGVTSKHPRDSMAFKWEDELKETVLTDIFWSNSRTGAINPVAIFEPIELEGTEVRRASVHNISIIENLELGIGDRITIYKANMIIPQIGENLTRSNSLIIPTECPVCNEPTTVEKSKEAKVLYCRNKDCMAKKIGKLNHFTSRDAMNIEGLSEATLERFVDRGLIHSYKDIYYLKDHKEVITKLEGFGIKSYNNIVEAVEKSREVDMPNFLYSLGVDQLGRTASRLICNEYEHELVAIINASENELMSIDGIGEISAREIRKYFRDNSEEVKELAEEMEFKQAVKVNKETSIADKTFVITGKLENYKNRKELQGILESMGAKVSGSVSKNTDYLINNDEESTSSKNKKAKELGVPIIGEAELENML